jgi:hypothetical protein
MMTGVEADGRQKHRDIRGKRQTGHEGRSVPSPSPDRQFAPGFRLSSLDVVILIAGAAGSAALSIANPWLGVAAAFVVGHFFLFCNVIRMARPLELIWAGAFAILAITSARFDAPSWPAVLITSTILTLILAAIQIRRPSYHGVGWRTLNPRLPDWWASRHNAAS